MSRRRPASVNSQPEKLPRQGKWFHCVLSLYGIHCIHENSPKLSHIRTCTYCIHENSPQLSHIRTCTYCIHENSRKLSHLRTCTCYSHVGSDKPCMSGEPYLANLLPRLPPPSLYIALKLDCTDLRRSLSILRSTKVLL